MRMNRLLCLAAIVGLTLMSLGGPSRAASREEQEAACGLDALRYCEAEIPDTARIEACLKRNLSRVSESCRKLLE